MQRLFENNLGWVHIGIDRLVWASVAIFLAVLLALIFVVLVGRPMSGLETTDLDLAQMAEDELPLSGALPQRISGPVVKSIQAVQNQQAKPALQTFDSQTEAALADCGQGSCAWQGGSRAEAARYFLHLKFGAAYEPPAANGIFADVAVESWQAPWVEAAFIAGLLPTCENDPGRICPDAPLTSDVEKFLVLSTAGR